MAAPEYVPTDPTAPPSYRSPAVVPEPWRPGRPASVGVTQPTGPGFGHQGPDQGYALTLTRLFTDRVRLAPGEDLDDVMAGAVQIALKRASAYGRAPVVHDVEVGLRVWGYLDDAPADLVAERRARFEGIGDPHHWRELRAVVDAVPETALRQSREAVTAAHRAGWRDLLVLDEPDT